MRTEIKSSFAFLVLMYNHQDYILEHLESIKFLVETHGAGIDIDIVLNDDCSTDQTRSFVDGWLKINAGLFRSVKTIYNSHNLGTCISVENMLAFMFADRCKLTAGDDVYSYENIFELTGHDVDVAIVSGRALYLLGNSLAVDRLSDLLSTMTQSIYKNSNLLHRFKHFSYNNAPNILYATECLLNPQVRSYLKCFDVTEDWPLQIAIARQYPNRKFKLIKEVLVYYRRTDGSTYIVANQRFVRDKIMLYDDLIKNENNWIERLRLRNRKFCFTTKYRFLNKILNFDLYFFLISGSLFFCRVLQNFPYDRRVIRRHELHYSYISYAARKISMQSVW